MSRNPDDENTDIDHCNHKGCYPFDPSRLAPIEHHHGTSIDNNLHQQLHLEDPKDNYMESVTVSFGIALLFKLTNHNAKRDTVLSVRQVILGKILRSLLERDNPTKQ